MSSAQTWGVMEAGSSQVLVETKNVHDHIQENLKQTFFRLAIHYGHIKESAN